MIIHKLHFDIKSAYYLLAIIIASFLFGYVIPGLIAYQENVYFEEDLRSKFLNKHVSTLTSQRKEVINNEIKYRRLDSTVTTLENSLFIDGKTVLANLEALKYFQEQKSKIKCPIIFRPFYLNQLMFFWAFIFQLRCSLRFLLCIIFLACHFILLWGSIFYFPIDARPIQDTMQKSFTL